MFRVLLAAFVLLLVLPQAEAQRGGRKTSKRPNTSASRSKNSRDKPEFIDRLWYGAGGTAGFSGFNGSSIYSIGLTPQVGYKFNEWLSAGPRLGATYTGIKAPTSRSNNPERAHLWDFNASAFARARIFDFYVQSEFGILSQNFLPRFFQTGRIPLDNTTLDIDYGRENQQVLLLGAGYNASVGGLGTDFGVFYNIFDDVNSIGSPISLRIMLTFGY